MTTAKRRAIDRRSKSQRRADWAQINASFAIEGLLPSEKELALQERLICGAITHEQALTQARRRYGLE